MKTTISFGDYSQQVNKWADVTLEKKRLDVLRAITGLVAELDEFYDEVESESHEKMMDEASDCIFWFVQFGNVDDVFGVLVADLDQKITSIEGTYQRLSIKEAALMNNLGEKLSRKKLWESKHIDPLLKVLSKHLNQVLYLTGATINEIANLNYTKLTYRKSNAPESVND